jgi:hypothetical protein
LTFIVSSEIDRFSLLDKAIGDNRNGFDSLCFRFSRCAIFTSKNKKEKHVMTDVSQKRKYDPFLPFIDWGMCGDDPFVWHAMSDVSKTKNKKTEA